MRSKQEVAALADAFMSKKADDDSKDGLTQAQILIQLAKDARLFHTPEQEAFARIRIGSSEEIFPIRNRGFRRWLTLGFYREFEKPPGAQALQDAIGVLEAKAQFDSPEATMFVRIAEHANRIYIDLGNVEREVVEIGPEGWRVMKDPPVHFRRTKGMRPLQRPERGGSIEMLRRFINVGSDSNWVLCASWLVAACRGRGPYPILIIQGEQGAAKSTMERILRRVIDPAVALIRTPPKSERDLLIAASNSLVVAYDNLSGIYPWLSDALCRLATGGGSSARELFTDSEEVFFDATRPVILNGIDHLADRADLADRALILNLPPIEEDSRMDEAQLYTDFERELPQILGAVYTAVSAALKSLPGTKLECKPRMADFALWAKAAEPALGFQPGAFLKAHGGNRAEAIQETLENDVVGAAILVWLDDRKDHGEEEWEGIAKELLQQLEKVVDEGTKKSGDWPKSPRALSGRLRRLATFFRASGIRVSLPEGKAAKGRRVLTIGRTAGFSTATSATSATQGPSGDSFQSVEGGQMGGGMEPRVAVESHADIEPPPLLPSAKPLNPRVKTETAAEVAVVAVKNPTILIGPDEPSNGYTSDPFERFEI